jgi:hypothetical protein
MVVRMPKTVPELGLHVGIGSVVVSSGSVTVGRLYLTVAPLGPVASVVTLAGGDKARSWSMLVRLKVAGVVTGVTVALTEYDPNIPLAVGDTDASPLAPVVALAVMPLFPKVAEAPVEGAVKVTETPETGSPKASVTVATRGFAKAVLTVADWFLPDVAVIAAGGLVYVTVTVPSPVGPAPVFV